VRPAWLDTRAYPFAPRAVEIDGARVHYVDEGDGPPVLLVHGLPTWSFVWRHLIAGLRDRYRCVALDLPGFGLSDKPEGDAYRPEDQARRLAAFVEALRLKDFTLVVHDFGGPIGLSLALDRPDAVRSLVLFNTSVQSACGMAGSATGPFYCPQDMKVYLDLDFFRALRDRFRAPGDFAQAYVIAHEVGHHVQRLLGITDRVMAERQRGGARGNAASVRLELQADCLAGVWAYHADRARHILEEGDVEEALAAAAAIGDDRLQRRAGGRTAPETFTHGTSEQRVTWFTRGIESGDLRQCDTFGGGV